MSETTERRPATTIGELDLHLFYMQGTLAKLVGAVENMATKNDIQQLEARMQSFATKAELSAVEAKLQSGTVESTFDRWASVVTKLGAVGAVLASFAAAVAALVHFLDRVPK